MAVKHKRTLASRAEAAVFNGYLRLFSSMPVETASRRGGALFRRLGPLLPLQHVARTNIRIAFPDISEADERALLAAQWDNLGRTVAEFPHVGDIDFYSPDSPVTVEGAEIYDAVRDGKNGAVFIAGHFANWEISAASCVRRGVPCHVTYRQANNMDIDQTIVALRAAYGVRLHAAKGREGGMGLLRALKKGEAVAIMNDQKYNEGVSAPLFGVEAMTADGPARLARRFGVPLIAVSVQRRPNARFLVRVHEPIAQSTHEDDETAIAQTVGNVNAWMEARIREKPEDWFWVHRRWPKALYTKK